jgi:hypothetical protein
LNLRPSGYEQDVDHLPELVDGSVEVPPVPTDLYIGLVHEPTVADRASQRPRRLDEQRSESLHPAKDRHVVDVDGPFGQQLLDIAVRQAEARATSEPTA